MTRLYLEAVVSTPKARALISNKLLVIDIWRLSSLRSIRNMANNILVINT